MRFGKIQYLNLMPFDVFLRSCPIPTRYKSAAFANRSYPSRLNQSFLFHRIDAGFISTIAGYTAHRKQRGTQAGIVAKGAVWSVLSLEEEDQVTQSHKVDSINGAQTLKTLAQDSRIFTNTKTKPRKDYQSDTSNALSTILGLQGRVLIGDRALQYRFAGGKAIDMGQAWWEKHRLPFVFGRLCYNKHAHFYTNIARTFVKKRVKIPHYILQTRAKACGIPSAYVREYLTHIHYHIQAKERIGLERFYRTLRLQAIKPPSRIYPRNVNSSKCALNAPYKDYSNV
ncbi:MqnA/MqnD/SBP family protein [Helicobacter sp.]|uniref:MqnA/MqnD/SBP family protein n=1 Tax=Helicobacter sp. TaxID=218 RepID=UPI0025BF616B|nr:MqnA/MqnD/SBP family protein [Helicobacter sp.]MBR2494245.1 menaquinone biosynthesis protein [Helicobacter sp.]